MLSCAANSIFQQMSNYFTCKEIRTTIMFRIGELVEALLGKLKILIMDKAPKALTHAL